MSDLKMPAGVALAGGAPTRAAMPDDDFSKRMGIALAASLGINFLLFAGAGLLANAMQKTVDPTPVQVTIRPVVAPATPIASPTPLPTVAPTPVPTAAPATPAPTPVPTPVATRPTPEPVRATPNPVRPTPVPVRSTPAPVPTPALTQKTTTSTAVKVAAAVTTAATAARVATATQRNNATATVDIKNPSLVAKNNSVATNTITPEMQRQLATIKPTSAQALKGTANGTTFVAKTSSASGGAAGAASLAPTGAARTNTVSGRTAAGAATLAPAALNPLVVQPEARSTIAGETRQATTVAGVASSAKGRTGVVTMNTKASEVSASAFTIQTGGTLKAGQATARQGGAGTNAVAAVAGAPTAISTNSEYAVYAPQVETRGVIGIRGTSRAPLGQAVTSLQQKGDIGQVTAGNAVLAAAPSGGGRGVTSAQARISAQAAGVSGTNLSASPGAGVGSGIVRGEGRSTGTAAIGNGTGSGAAGKGVGKTVGVGQGVGGGNERGGKAGQVRGVENGVAGGTPDRTGTVGGRATAAGNAKAAEGSAAKAADKVTDKVAGADAQQVKRAAVSIDPDVEASQLDLPGKLNAQIAARPTSKGSFDLPDSLRSTKFKGDVIVRVTVEANGSHSEEIVDGSGNDALDAAVKAYMRGWRWEAAKQDGKAVRSTTKVNLPIEVK